ncbi:WD40 repeat domain-containing protein [Nocardiopsis metallicus]|uniref:WD40 repeat protein n=1 Tax=Nocardiopsis metallicus TaxID=179819 RepID=A0A840WH56_9ACTN|nr:hypothetical protein [Nocardiopsis metallicus]MBB5490766.1 WD40 repeat protein [Nocardiopsis metallicus]
MLGSTHGTGLWPLEVGPDGSLLATAGDDQLVRVWDVAGRGELRQLTGHSAFTRGAGLSPDGALPLRLFRPRHGPCLAHQGWPGAVQIASRRCR